MNLQIAATAFESAPLPRPPSLRIVGAPAFLECVGVVARELREHAEAELIDIAYWSRASQGAISRFERGDSQPRDLDRLLLAYAKMCGVSPTDILQQAIRRWEDEGGAELPASPFPGGPLLPEGGAIEQRAQAGSPRRPTPAPRRSAGEGRKRGRG